MLSDVVSSPYPAVLSVYPTDTETFFCPGALIIIIIIAAKEEIAEKGRTVGNIDVAERPSIRPVCTRLWVHP